MNPLFSQAGLPDLEREIEFTTSKSSGKGGQHVNTTETRVELKFNIRSSFLLRGEQKDILLTRLHSRLTEAGTLRMYSQKERSQAANKEDVLIRFYLLLFKALKPVKKRIPVKPGKAARESRLRLKRALSQKKNMRRLPGED
jgi:ribosome-associated protein